MTAESIYQWDYVAPFATVGLYRHGYDDRTAQTFSAVPFQILAESGPTQHVTINQGIVKRHVDGTVAREVWIKNEGIWALALRLDQIVENVS
jgi:hypothetical protein